LTISTTQKFLSLPKHLNSLVIHNLLIDENKE
jgi:hypothetical protein